jgi:hypothetical protein
MTELTPKEYRAMAFFSQDYVKAASLATRFAGEQGRIATLPDVIDARLATPLGKAPWEQYICTNSAEYFGFSKAGNPIIVVAHGIGPISTPEGVVTAYKSPLKPVDHGRTGMEGRVSQVEFLRLADGQYGEVAIVDFRDYESRYEYPFLESLTAWQAAEDPLVRARLGSRTEEYLKRHHQEALAWAGEEDEAISKGEIEHYGIKRTRPIGTERYKIIQVGDPNNSGYRFRTPDEAPLAHYLTIEQLMLRNGDSLHSGIDCRESGTGAARVVGIRGGEPIDDIAPSIRIDRHVIVKHLDRFLKPVEGERQLPPLFRLSKAGETWFTQYGKEGSRLDTGQLEYVVRGLEPVPAQAKEFWTRWGGYYGFFKYDVEEVQALAPEGANAYRFTGEPRIEGPNHIAPIEFYRADVDTTRFIPQREELEADFDTLIWLVSQK